MLSKIGLLFIIGWLWLCVAKMEDDTSFKIKRKKK